MPNIVQYDFFHQKTPEEEIREELAAVEKSLHKVRKGQYASLNELKKMVLEIKEDVDLIKRHLCQNK